MLLKDFKICSLTSLGVIFLKKQNKKDLMWIVHVYKKTSGCPAVNISFLTFVTDHNKLGLIYLANYNGI